MQRLRMAASCSGCQTPGSSSFSGALARPTWASQSSYLPGSGIRFRNLNNGQAAKIFAWFNSTFSEVWFHYPDNRDGDECSRAVSCAFTEGNAPWSTHEIARTTGVGSGVFDFPILLC
jgi:hypothetical protein